MTVEVKYNFDSAADYTFDLSVIEVTGGVARLKLANNVDQEFTQDFASDSGFTYDNAKAEFSSGQVQQKNQRPNQATWGATYSTDINANWGDVASLIPVSTRNNPQVSNGQLVLVTDKNIIYDTTGAINPIRGAMKMKFTPGYDIVPPNQQGLFHYSTPTALGSNNRFYLDHTTGGILVLTLLTSTGGNMGSANFGTWNPTLGTEYELEINWDFTPGSEAIRLFIDGVQQGSTLTNSGTRDNNINIASELRVGGAVDSRYFVSDFVTFSEVQHTANYTPGYTLSDYEYAETAITLPAFNYQGQGVIQSFQSLAEVAVGSGKWVLNGKYFDGGAWVISDYSYAQANTIAEINANIGSAQVSNSVIIDLVFPNSVTQNIVSDFTFTYTGQYYVSGSTIVPNTHIPVTSLSEYIESAIKPANTDIVYAIEINAIDYWFNGGSWVTSNGVNETNTATEINDNLETLPIQETGDFIVPRIYFITDGSGTSELDYLCLKVSYDVNPVDKPGTTILFASLIDMIADYQENTGKLIIENEEQFFVSGNSVEPGRIEKTANAEGIAALQVVKTASVSKKYKFSIGYRDSKNQQKEVVLGYSVAPDDTASNIANLTFTSENS